MTEVIDVAEGKTKSELEYQKEIVELKKAARRLSMKLNAAKKAGANKVRQNVDISGINFDINTARDAMILSEIFRPPVSKRRGKR